MKDIQEIVDMHEPRPHGSRTEQQWIERWLMPLPGATADEFGNIWVVVGDDDGGTIFSSHTDTVNKFEVPFDLKLDDGVLTAFQDGKQSVLGADCTAGVWLMTKMIRSGVPGTYIFHRGEEMGGLGSSALTEKYDFSKWKRVIAFDRAGYGDVITFQHGMRCCSDEFATELSHRLNCWGDFEYALSSEGVYTDSAEYTDDVPECTNISVGYFRQHTTSECLDVFHLVSLAEACVRLDWASLPTVRDPKTVEYAPVSRWAQRPLGSIKGWLWDDDDFVIPQKEYNSPGLGLLSRRDDMKWDLLGLTDWDEIVDAVRSDPEAAAAVICEELGITFR